MANKTPTSDEIAARRDDLTARLSKVEAQHAAAVDKAAQATEAAALGSGTDADLKAAHETLATVAAKREYLATQVAALDAEYTATARYEQRSTHYKALRESADAIKEFREEHEEAVLRITETMGDELVGLLELQARWRDTCDEAAAAFRSLGGSLGMSVSEKDNALLEELRDVGIDGWAALLYPPNEINGAAAGRGVRRAAGTGLHQDEIRAGRDISGREIGGRTWDEITAVARALAIRNR